MLVSEYGHIITCFLLCFGFLGVKATENGPRFTACLMSSDNITRGSTYESNLKALLSNFSSSANAYHASGFLTAESGSSPDVAYGLFLCRGDLSAGACGDCVASAAEHALDRCLSVKDAILWYREGECMLRYSNYSFFGLYQPSMTITLFNNSEEPTPDLNFGTIGFIFALIDKAQRSEKLYAAGESEDANSEKRYGLVQCTRDLNASACGSCLSNLTSESEKCCKGKVGWGLYNPSCILRYESFPFFNPTPEGGAKHRKARTIVMATVPSVAGLALLVGLYYYFSSRWRRAWKEIRLQDFKSKNLQGPLLDGGIIDAEHDDDQQMHYISLQTILDATNGFCDDNKLGEGGFGPVYKGKLPNGKDLAIKRLSTKSSQGLTEFKNEVILIIKLQHRNLVRLLGYCVEEDEKLLIYEFMSNKSLDAFLFDPLKCKELDWEKRMKIIHGTTRGLQYLHEDSRLKIIHRDLKASNILLDDEMNPKISDFGTARIFGYKQVEASTERIVGTFGYMSPEYALGGMISEKSDIYSFGVLLLEIISGKKAIRPFSHGNQQLSLIAYAWESWCETKGLNLVDQALADSYSPTEVMRCVHVALLCVQDNPMERPSSSQVVHMLSSDKELPNPKQPTFTFRNALSCVLRSTSDCVYSINEATQTTMEGR